MLRFEDGDGRPIRALTVHCDAEHGSWLALTLRDWAEDLDRLAAEGREFVVTFDFASSQTRDNANPS
jgi:hypothetical protein